jgi:hypothetical protein
MNETTYAKMVALAKHLECDVSEVTPAGGDTDADEDNFYHNQHQVRRGTTPEQAVAVCDKLRKALFLAVEYASARVITFIPGQEEVCATPFRLVDLADLSVQDLRLAAYGVALDDQSVLVDDMVWATYDNLVKLLEACPESAKMLKDGVHDVVNTLYFLCPETDDHDHAKDHRDSLREAWDGQKVVDRSKLEWTQSGEYMLLTDDEADIKWKECLESYLEECVLAELPETAQMYFDRDRWMDDAKVDGRGHSISSYDGCEHEETVTVCECCPCCEIDGEEAADAKWFKAYSEDTRDEILDCDEDHPHTTHDGALCECDADADNVVTFYIYRTN